MWPAERAREDVVQRPSGIVRSPAAPVLDGVEEVIELGQRIVTAPLSTASAMRDLLRMNAEDGRAEAKVRRGPSGWPGPGAFLSGV